MTAVTACTVPEGSLLAAFGGPQDYRDCFCRDVQGAVSLSEFMERFYTSTAFVPERFVLKAIAGPSSRADARAFARGEADRFGAWEMVERRSSEALALSKGTNTASWFYVDPQGARTRLYFGSWVGNLGQSGWRFMEQAHVWYSRVLLGGV